jgi:ketopantoate hydroxymethyltransferase
VRVKDCRDAYGYNSQKAGDVARQLAFAGIGLIWVFRTGADAATKIGPELYLPTLLLGAGLACDLLQYVVASGIWGFYGRYRE